MATKAEKSAADLCRYALGQHSAHWDHRRQEMRELRGFYAVAYWKTQPGATGARRVEVPDGRSHVDQYIGTLFTRDPAVEVADPKAGAVRVPAIAVQGVVNDWLSGQREELERATRTAITYPGCAVRLTWCDDRWAAETIMPWDLIVDRDAPSWDRARWIGHRYTLTLGEAKTRWPGKRWAIPQDAGGSWIDGSDGKRGSSIGGSASALAGGGSGWSGSGGSGGGSLPEDLRAVTIVEVHDLKSKTVVWWSPALAVAGVLETAEEPLEVGGRSAHPYIPYAVSYLPDQPTSMLGSLSTIRDQLKEKSASRSAQAAQIRKQSRQFITPAGVLGAESLARITSGEDGAIVEVDASEMQQWGERILTPVAQTAVSQDIAPYVQQVESDLGRGSVLAAFARGEATKATATEVGVLAQYSSSELGRMARQRDVVIERLARLYLAAMSLENGPVGVVEGVEVMGPDCEAAWQVTALDQAGTPMSRAIERQGWMTLLPVLGQLGVDPAELRRHTIRLFELPPEWADPPIPDAPPPIPDAAPPDPTTTQVQTPDAVPMPSSGPGGPSPTPSPTPSPATGPLSYADLLERM